MYAVVSTGGKQLKVEKGAEAVVEKLDAAVGESVSLDVVFIADGDDIVVDSSALSSASVTAEVIEHFKADKVVVFKFKKRKGYKRTRGHRQDLTRLRIVEIAGAAKPARKKAEPAEAAASAETAASVEAKPKRTRAKKAEPAEPKASAEPAAATEEKPKRTRAKKAEPAEAKASAETAAAPAAEKPKRTRTKKAAEAEASAESAESGE